jgi:hypothetical protein
MSELSDLFRAMADRIDRVGDAEFGGALLIVPPPDQSGQNQAIEVLLIDPKRDPANYWAMATSKVQTAAAVFEEKARAMEQQRFR